MWSTRMSRESRCCLRTVSTSTARLPSKEELQATEPQAECVSNSSLIQRFLRLQFLPPMLKLTERSPSPEFLPGATGSLSVCCHAIPTLRRRWLEVSICSTRAACGLTRSHGADSRSFWGILPVRLKLPLSTAGKCRRLVSRLSWFPILQDGNATISSVRRPATRPEESGLITSFLAITKCLPGKLWTPMPGPIPTFFLITKATGLESGLLRVGVRPRMYRRSRTRRIREANELPSSAEE